MILVVVVVVVVVVVKGNVTYQSIEDRHSSIPRYSNPIHPIDRMEDYMVVAVPHDTISNAIQIFGIVLPSNHLWSIPYKRKKKLLRPIHIPHASQTVVVV
jgi:hypothetical protein